MSDIFMENINAAIVAEITKQIPKKQMIEYLMNLLSLSRESIYRRIKSSIPFTLEELAIIANNLNFSIDQLLKRKVSNNTFRLGQEFDISQDSSELYINSLYRCNEMMEGLKTSTNIKVSAVVNRIPLRFFPYEMLLKFEYCQYLYSTGSVSFMTQFSDVVVPAQVTELHQKIISNFNLFKNMTCIIDSMVYSKILSEIQYYHRLKFISVEDLHVLQNELLAMLNMFEELLRKGESASGSNFVVYYSYLNLESNIIFHEYDDNYSLHIYNYPESVIEIENNPLIRDLHKKWFDSKIRNSVLVSKIYDTYQIELLRNAQQQLLDLTKI